MRLSLPATLIALGVLAGAPPAVAETQQFFDMSSRKWVTIKPSRFEMERVAREKYARRIVDVQTRQPPGTIIINTDQRFLYLIQPGGKAIRYGIGVGREGFTWSGTQKITRKAEWPGWTPPPEMIARQPNLPRYMPGGPNNPLGARALYLGNTLYRIHGTNEAWSIGQAVSSGCIRMMNDDVIDLYNRVPVGTKVVVVGPALPMPAAFMNGVGDSVSSGVQSVGDGVTKVGSAVADGISRGVSSLSTLIPN